MSSSSKRSAKSRRRDLHADREAAKYERPIPSREFILEQLETLGASQSQEQIAQLLGIDDEDGREALRRRLRAMERDAQLIRDRRGLYAPINKLDLVRGRVSGHPDGFGFLIPDDSGDDLYLNARQMRSLMHGDRALVRISGIDRRGRREGALVEVLERNTQQIVGRLFEESGVSVVVPENKRFSQDVLIPADARGGAQHGQIVMARIVQQPHFRRQSVGEVIEVLGEHMAPGMEIDIAVRANGLPHEWPEAVEREAADYSEQVRPRDKRGRTDLRKLPLVTIDGADARDFDDAVYCNRTPNGWRLVVAIADVSHYVRPDSALDREAWERGNSVYFPQRVIPMLPEVLSNGLCSLNPDVDRLCMVCDVLVDRQGKVTRSRFYEGLMRSHARLTYDQVAAILVEGDEELRQEHAKLFPHLQELHALYKVLHKQRQKRGAIDFDTTESSIVFGPERKIEKVVPLVRNDAHRLIEECMILANVCTAQFLERHGIAALYRVHEPPAEDKVEDLRQFLGEFGVQFKGGESPSPRAFSQVLRQVRDRPDRHLIETVLLRSLRQAQYTPDNHGHFGLAHESYTHFTSPIRRYPDLLVHRAVRHLVRAEPARRRAAAKRFHYNHEDMLKAGEHCSMTERRADEATRDAVSWLKCEFMLDKVGEVFDGTIASVTSFGIFVELDKVFVEGLVHVTSLEKDFFHFDPVGHRLVGERTRTMYRLGDRITVKVMQVDLDKRRIDFELSERGAPSPGRRRAGKRTVKEEQGAAGEGQKSKRGQEKSKSKSKRKGKGKATAKAKRRTHQAKAGAGQQTDKTESTGGRGKRRSQRKRKRTS